MLTLADTLPQTRLSAAADHLNKLYENATFDDIRSRMGQLDTLEFEVTRLILDILGRSDNRSISDIYRDGLINLLEDEGTRQAVRVLEERTLLANVISQSMIPETSGVQVVIGGDGRWEELKDCTIILSRYGVPDDFSGTVAVIGQTRMPYARNIAAVRYVAELMSNFIYDYYADPFQREYLEDKELDR
jgi:heat-inducible transcriptional repressor